MEASCHHLVIFKLIGDCFVFLVFGKISPVKDFRLPDSIPSLLVVYYVERKKSVGICAFQEREQAPFDKPSTQ